MGIVRLLLLLLYFPLLAQTSTIESIDTAVETIAQQVQIVVPDEKSVMISVQSFLSDKGGKNILGDRIKGGLELYLVDVYEHARILERSAEDVSYTIIGVIQPFEEKIRIVAKIVRHDGVIVGGKNVHMDANPELTGLLIPSELVGIEKRPQIDDHYEPDDNPGFEVEVEEGQLTVFERYLAARDKDRFIFQISDPKTVILQTATNVDTRMSLYFEGETVPFAVNDDLTGSDLSLGASKIEIDLGEGIYIVEVTGYDELTTGIYRIILNLSGAVNDEFEPDNSPEVSSNIFPGEIQERYLEPDDVDWVELKGELLGFYTIYTEGETIAIQLGVFDKATGHEIISDNEDETSFNGFVGLWIGATNVVAQIKAIDASLEGSYDLWFQSLQVPFISPDGTKHELVGANQPQFLVLRVLRPGTYTLKMTQNTTQIRMRIFNLPGMEEQVWDAENLSDKSWTRSFVSGDYLLKFNVPESTGIIFVSIEEQKTTESDAHGNTDR